MTLLADVAQLPMNIGIRKVAAQACHRLTEAALMRVRNQQGTAAFFQGTPSYGKPDACAGGGGD